MEPLKDTNDELKNRKNQDQENKLRARIKKKRNFMTTKAMKLVKANGRRLKK